MTLRRKSGPANCPKDTQNNRADFKQNQSRTLGKYNRCDGPYPDDRNEYTEIYNAGSKSIDPVEKGYRLKDSLDKNGKEVDRWYRIVGFPNYPNTSNTGLDPGQIGLILRPNADTPAFSDLNQARIRAQEESLDDLRGTLYHKFTEGDVKLYTTYREGNETLLTDGLHNSKMERLTLERPGKVPPEVNILRLDHGWYPLEVKPFEARVKINPSGQNIYQNWKQVPWGSPGAVSE
ncbi:MAG: hypothetical protein ABEK50_14350 [bacterium]